MPGIGHDRKALQDRSTAFFRQVLATTHSPYVLDLFVDTPEDVVIAAKEENGAAVFKRLVDIPELREMLQSGRLGDLWYSGILGGVP